MICAVWYWAVVFSLSHTTPDKKSTPRLKDLNTSPQDIAARMSALAIDPFQIYPSDVVTMRKVRYTNEKECKSKIGAHKKIIRSIPCK